MSKFRKAATAKADLEYSFGGHFLYIYLSKSYLKIRNPTSFRYLWILVLSSIFRKFVSDKMKLRTGTPVMERLRSA